MAYLMALVVAFLLASITATQSVVARLAEMGMEVDLLERLRMTLRGTNRWSQGL